MSKLHNTFELYIDTGDGERVFEPLTAPSRADLPSVVQAMMRERELKSVEVHELGVHLFTLKS